MSFQSWNIRSPMAGNVRALLEELGEYNPAVKMFRDGADAVELLFNCLPMWQSDPYAKLLTESLVLRGQPHTAFAEKYISVLKIFLHVVTTRPSTDPDADTLRKFAQKALATNEYKTEIARLDAVNFAQDLARLAAKTPLPTAQDQLTKKAMQLAYYRWLAGGRKDELRPEVIKKQVKKQITPAPPACKAFLPDNTDVKCTGCGKSGDNFLKCQGCLVQKEGHFIFQAAYCSRDCQVKDWENHRDSCRELRRIARAATLYHELLAHLYKVACYNDIESISEEDGLIYVKCGEDEEVHYTGKSNLRPFPEHLAPSAEVASAVMMYGKTVTDHHIGVHKKLFAAVFADTFAWMERVSTLPKNAAFVVERDIDSKSPNHLSSLSHHEVVRITTKSGLSIAFDPNGSLYGWKELISDWFEYRKHRVAETYPSHKEFKATEVLQIHRQGLDWIAEAVSSQVDIVVAMSKALHAEAASISEGGDVLKVLNINNPDEFKQARDRLLQAGKAAAGPAADAARANPTYRTYITRRGMVKRVGSQEMYDKMKQVWLSDELYEQVKDDPAELSKLWIERLGKVGL